MKQKTAKLIGFFAIFISITGLLNQALISFGFSFNPSSIGFIFHQVLNLFPAFPFSIEYFDHVFSYDSPLRRIHFIPVIFSIVLLFGGILFLVTKQKEMRLLRFSFSILFLCGIIGFISQILILVFAFGPYIIENKTSAKLIFFLYVILNCFWTYVIYRILRYLNKSRVLEEDQFTQMVDDQSISPELIECSKTQRLGHFIIDTILCVILFSPLLLFFPKFLDKWMIILGERTILYIFMFISRIIYYLLFEITFGATPSKYLSETKVRYYDGSRASTQSIFIRTISRFVPFEPCSFLFSYGWHDTWSDTYVFREKRTGVKGRHYWWIIVFFVLTIMGTSWGGELYKRHKTYVWNKGEYNDKIEIIETQLKNLTTDKLIKLSVIEKPGDIPKDNYGYAKTNLLFLKIEKIEGDKITASKIWMDKHDYSLTIKDVEDYYTQASLLLEEVEFSRADLQKAYIKDYDDENSPKGLIGTNLLKDGATYKLVDITTFFSSKLTDGTPNSMSGSYLSLGIKNEGSSATLVDIKSIEGSINWNNSLPERIDAVRSDYTNYSFQLTGDNYKSGSKYKCELVLKDSLDRTQVYLVEGADLDYKIKQIK